jgi:aspartate kinase
MKPLVMKFGGTSVGDGPAFARAANIVFARLELKPVVVVSAMSGMTDALLDATRLANEGDVRAAIELLEPHYDRHVAVVDELLGPAVRTAALAHIQTVRNELTELLNRIGSGSSLAQLTDSVLSQGERLSSFLLAAVLREYEVASDAISPQQCIITDSEFGCAAPLLEQTFEATNTTINPLLAASVVPVLGGFIGATEQGETTTLGRGGSDYTAALIGAALSAREIQIWTDVTGVLTADPKVVSDAQTVPRLSYAEAAELAYFGAKVLHPKTIQPAVEGSIPVRICNSRLPLEEGTLVAAESEASPRTVKAIAHKTGVTTLQITSARMLGAYGFLRALFEVFDRHRTAVDVVTTSEVSVSLSLDDAAALPAITAELEKLAAVRVERGRAIICVVGEGLRGTPGIAAQVFNTISDINVTLISQGASSINLTFAIEEERVAEAVSRLHCAFFGDDRKLFKNDRKSRIQEIGRRVSAYSAR